MYCTHAQNNTVYINPNYSGVETGTINQPYNSWSDINFSNNTAYLQKRGTSTVGDIVVSTKNNVLIGAYGSGSKPIITGIAGNINKILVFNGCTNCAVENINFVGHQPEAPTAGIFLNGYSAQTYNITIQNCDISNCFNGVRVIPSNHGNEKLTIDNCNIYNINEDGIFASNLSKFTCKNTLIDRVNLDWHYQCHEHSCASGDGIHLTGNCDDFLIENCIIDRRYTGLKFCFIHNSDDGGYGNDGIIRDCTFYSPKDTIGAPSAGGAIFLFDGDSILIERTKFIGSNRLYSNDIGIGGQVSFDNIIMNYVLGDSVINFSNTFRCDNFVANNITWTGNRPGSTALNLSNGNVVVNNCAVAATPGTTPILGTYSGGANKIYVGSVSNWAGEFGWSNWADEDYHLQSSSSLIDDGINLSLLSDMDGISVPQGNAPDIGCYEYVQTSGQAPVGNFYSSDTIIAYGDSVGFYDASLYNPNTWVWVFNGAVPVFSNKQNPVVHYISSGFHDVVLVVSNEFGSNTITKSQYIEVSDPFFNPVAGFSVTDTVLMVGDNVNFTDESVNNPTSWLWLFDGGTPSQSTIQNPTVVYNSAGSYNVKLYVSNDSGGDTLVKNNFIHVYSTANPPISNFSVSDSVITINESISFTDESTNTPNSWTWIFQQGSPPSSNLQNPSVTFNSIGEYYVALIAENPFGSDIEVKTNYITVYNPALPLIAEFSSIKNIEFCGSPVKFQDLSVNGAITWDWNFGDGQTNVQRNPTVIFNNPGNYDISLTVTSEVSSNTKTKTEYIEILPIDQFIKFEDDFNDGILYPAWTVKYGNWNENNGLIHQYNYYYADSYLYGSYALIGSPLWEDYIITCNLRSVNNNGIGLVFNYQDDKNMYMFFWRKSSNERKLIRWINGNPFVMAEDQVPFSNYAWYNTRITCNAGNISVKINGSEIFNVNDNTFTSGKVGLYSWANNGCYFDNFKVTSLGTEINLQAFLEGPFEVSGMTSHLNNQGLLPLSQPYSGPPWSYLGYENVSSIPNSNITDWVLIEFRDAVSATTALPSTKIYSQAAFILNDGKIVDLDGSSLLRLSSDVDNQLFVVIHHRNHLSVMSSSPLFIYSGKYYYNFTTSVGKAFGTNALKSLGNGKYGLYSGDFNSDGFINIFDKNYYWKIGIGKRGYFRTDGNFDSQVDNEDKNGKWLINNGKTSQVPKTNNQDQVNDTEIEYY